MRAERRNAARFPSALLILTIALLTGFLLSGCGDGPTPTAAEKTTHEAKKKEGK